MRSKTSGVGPRAPTVPAAPPPRTAVERNPENAGKPRHHAGKLVAPIPFRRNQSHAHEFRSSSKLCCCCNIEDIFSVFSTAPHASPWRKSAAPEAPSPVFFDPDVNSRNE